MERLGNEQLLNVVGGVSFVVIGKVMFVVTGVISFISGLLSGYTNPEPCN